MTVLYKINLNYLLTKTMPESNRFLQNIVDNGDLTFRLYSFRDIRVCRNHLAVKAKNVCMQGSDKLTDV